MEAQEYEKLVKALRHCTTRSNGCVTCAGCPMSSENGDVIECINALHKDAAAAIEDLQAEVDALKHDIERYVGINAELTTENEALQAEVKDRGTKRGKWIYKPKDAIEMMFTLPKCSVCGHESSDANNFCPNCGAKMTEVQE